MSWKKNLIVGASIAGAATLTIHLINKFVYFSATLDNLLSNPSGSYYNWKFGNIYYTKSGEGKPVLLIHNLSTFSSGYEWHLIKEKLAKTNTVYCIDLLGCGRSDKPNLIYTNYLYVQLITDFIKRVIGEKCDVIASGESGSFAVAACQNNPEIIDQIVMVNPSDIHHLAKSPSKRTKTLTRLKRYFIIKTSFPMVWLIHSLKQLIQEMHRPNICLRVCAADTQRSMLSIV